MVHAQGGDGVVEALTVFFKGGFNGGAQGGVRDARDDAKELGLHLERVVLRDRREATHDRRVGALGVGDGRELVDLEIGAAVEIADRTADADNRAGLEGHEHRLDRRITEEADFDVVGRIRDDGFIISRTGLRGLGGDFSQGADRLEAGANRGGLTFAEGQEWLGHEGHRATLPPAEKENKAAREPTLPTRLPSGPPAP